jgi:putative ABC transport system permease protein
MGDLKIKIKKEPIRWAWTFKMAWRDSRKSWGRLLLFTSSIVLGIAALVAINSFSENLEKDIERQANELLGADLQVSTSRQVPELALRWLDSLKSDMSREQTFASMVYFPKTNGTRLIQVRALEGAFPYYGEIETIPASASENFKKKRHALVDETLMIQYGVQVGDSVRIGNISFLIEGSIQKVPGQSGIVGTAAPPVYIPLRYLKETGLIQPGSRVTRRYYYQFQGNTPTKEALEIVKEILNDDGISYETVESRKENLGKTFANMNQFLNLVAFVALLLGCVGVASSVHIYIKEKKDIVAILRCFGTQGKQAFFIYLIQILFMGLAGSLTGAFLGSALQYLIPFVMSDFLPVEVNFSFSAYAVLHGIITGVCISLLFALLPLLDIRKASPLSAIRSGYENRISRFDPLKITVYLLVTGFIFIFIYMQNVGGWRTTLIFTLALIVAFSILAGIAKLVMYLLRKFFPTGWAYVWRQGLANLYRPHNQTLILITAIGLGTALLTTLYFIQGLLIDQVTFAGSGNMPNMVMFDIQSDQKEELKDLTAEFELPVMQEVPIVTMRLRDVNGITRSMQKEYYPEKMSEWIFNHEFRVTYRDSLIDSETLIEGSQQRISNDTIYITIAERLTDDIMGGVGEVITFNIQGRQVRTVVAGIRRVDWNRVQTNFLVVFPEGILEEAPQFHVIMTKVP